MRLTPEQLKIKKKFTRQIESNAEHFLAEYRRLFDKLLDTDNARELSPDYSHSKQSRSLLGSAVHQPAGNLIWMIWKRMLGEVDPTRGNHVLIMAGGAGSGKTSTARTLLREAYDSAQIIYDTTLSNLKDSIEKVEAALNAGKSVTILYIHRPIENAVQGMLKRALETGRVVPLKVMSDNHFDAQRTLFNLYDRYSNQVEIQIIDNSGDRFNPKFVTLDFLKKRRYKRREAVRERARRTFERECRKRRGTSDEIPEYVREAITRE
jgi:type II secretory pathway predicted ATPase ExeA